MKIIVVIGMPAATKDIVRKYTEIEHYPYISTGDIIRREVKKEGWMRSAKDSRVIRRASEKRQQRKYQHSS